MKCIDRIAVLLVLGGSLAVSSTSWAQCSGGRGQSGSTGSQTTGITPYNQNSLNSGYSLNNLSPTNYQQIAMAAAYSRQQQMAAMQQALIQQAQLNAANVRYQTEAARNYRKELDRASVELRKKSERDAADAAALKEERLAARKAKKNRVDSMAEETSRLVAKK